jgi:hypothetical protein
MRRPLFVLSVLLSFSATGHAEEDNNSGMFWQPKCKALLNGAPSPNKLTVACGGMIMALKGLGSYLEPPLRTCIPEDATILQMARVITKAIDEHPEQINRQFLELAIEAMQNAWPCQK